MTGRVEHVLRQFQVGQANETEALAALRVEFPAADTSILEKFLCRLARDTAQAELEVLLGRHAVIDTETGR